MTQTATTLKKPSEPEKSSVSEKFTGKYAGYDPQFGLGAAMEANSSDGDFELENLEKKYQVMTDNYKLDHTPQIPPDDVFDLARAPIEGQTGYPDHYMDVDDKNSFMAQMRQRDKIALDGRARANTYYFTKFYKPELDEKEISSWWGAREYEPTETYGELKYL
jgi:hypothetical protein